MAYILEIWFHINGWGKYTAERKQGWKYTTLCQNTWLDRHLGFQDCHDYMTATNSPKTTLYIMTTV